MRSSPEKKILIGFLPAMLASLLVSIFLYHNGNLVLGGSSKQSMSKIRTILDGMKAEERQLLERRDNILAQGISNLVNSTEIALVIQLALLCLLYWLVDLDFPGRHRTEPALRRNTAE